MPKTRNELALSAQRFLTGCEIAFEEEEATHQTDYCMHIKDDKYPGVSLQFNIDMDTGKTAMFVTRMVGEGKDVVFVDLNRPTLIINLLADMKQLAEWKDKVNT